MKFISISVILLAMMTHLLHAQNEPNVEWVKNFGGSGVDIGYYVQQTQDKGYVIVGETFSFDDTEYGDVYLIRIDSLGNLEWQKTFGGSSEFWGEDWGSCVQQTQDKGYIITGTTQSFNDTIYEDVYLIKTDLSGNLEWQKTFGGIYEDRGNFVRQTQDKGYIITGSTQSFNDTINGDFYLIKTDSFGNLQWQKTFGGSGEEEANTVQQTNDNGYIIIGKGKVSNSYYAYLIKTDSLGNLQWQRTYGENEEECGNFSGQQTIDKGYIITGLIRTSEEILPKIFLLKADSLGNLQWQNTFGGNERTWSNFVQQTQDKGYIVVGFIDGGRDVYVIKMDSLAIHQWKKTFGGAGYDEGYCVQQTQDGGYIITGEYFNISSNDKNVYLIKIEP
ncbi:MAG: hypothetical protein OEZ20_04400 [candidate division WOR-3 bacterium]|nr:hypothetical protein [candidate division WOR-3 bacterium]